MLNSVDRWSRVMTRITKNDAPDIDHITGSFDHRRNPIGQAIFPQGINPLLPQTIFSDQDLTCIGVRITEPRGNLAEFAVRLTMLGLEKNVEVIVFSHLPYSGLEKFGFRCERIVGATEEELTACERQLKQFWNIEIII